MKINLEIPITIAEIIFIISFMMIAFTVKHFSWQYYYIGVIGLLIIYYRLSNLNKIVKEMEKDNGK